MDYTIENLEMLWDTFDFHTEQLGELESKIVDAFNELHIFLENNLNPTQKEKLEARRLIDDCCDKSIACYKKQVHAINELFTLYFAFRKKNISVPIHRKVKLNFLVQLRSTTLDLMSVMSLYKDRVTEILH